MAHAEAQQRAHDWYHERRKAGFKQTFDPETGNRIWVNGDTGETIACNARPSTRNKPRPKRDRSGNLRTFDMDDIRKKAATCISRWDFGKHFPHEYSWACRNKVIADLFPVTLCRHHTVESVTEIARKFKSRKEFATKDPAAYDWAIRHGIMDGLFPRLLRKPITEEYATESKSRFSSRSEFAKGDQASYNWARRHGKLDEWFPKFLFTKEHCAEKAALCKCRGEFKRRFYTEWKHSRKNGWIDEFDFPDKGEVLSRSLRKISDEDIINEARKYRTLGEFSAANRNMLQYAYHRHLTHLFTWMDRSVDIIERGFMDCVYAYMFPETRTAYVGRTVEPSRRHRHHCKKKDTVAKYARSRHLPVPEMTILIDGVTPKEGARLEAIAMEEFRNRGWKLINKAKAGSLGGLARRKLCRKHCLEVARSCHTVYELHHDHPSEYNALRQHGWISECDWLVYLRRPAGTWSKADDETLRQEAMKYNTRNEFMHGSRAAYYIASTRGLMDTLFPNPVRGPKKVDRLTLDGKLVRTYDTIQECADDLGVKAPCISAICRKLPSHHTVKGFTFRYHEGP